MEMTPVPVDWTLYCRFILENKTIPMYAKSSLSFHPFKRSQIISNAGYLELIWTIHLHSSEL